MNGKSDTTRLITICCGVVATYLLILLFFRQAIFDGRTIPAPDAFSGENRKTLSMAILPPERNAVGRATLSRLGSRALLVTQDESNHRYISLWEQGTGFSDLTDRTIVPVGEPSFSESGIKVIFFATSQDKNVGASLYIWEEGFGIIKVPFGTFTGSWNVTLAPSGNRALLLPQKDASFSGTAHTQAADGAVGLNETKGEKGFLLEFLPKIEQNNNKAAPLGPYLIRFTPAELPQIEPKAVELIGESFNGTAISMVETSKEKKPELVKASIAPLKNLDVDGDGHEDYLLFAQQPDFPIWKAVSTGSVDGTHNSPTAVPSRSNSWRAGAADGIPVPGDYNGDGVMDLATYRPGESSEIITNEPNWQIFISKPPALMGERALSPTGGTIRLSWGFGKDIPVPADYDGDGATDIGVFNHELGKWHILFAKGEFNIPKGSLHTPGFGTSFQLGDANSIPVVADYNGDGRADPAVWQAPKEGEKNGNWVVNYLDLDGPVLKGSASQTDENLKQRTINFGIAGDVPIAGDFNCDGRAEPAVYRPSEKTWVIRYGERRIARIRWAWPGVEKTLPIIGDYDGDGCLDLGLYIPDGFVKWYIRSSRFAPKARSKMPNGLNIVTSSSSGIEGGLPPQVWQREMAIEKSR